MPISSQANALSGARIEIARISEASNEQILDQQVAYAAGYIRCAQDHELIP
jgi:sulfite reductase beta subunit-like hemoprotein